MSTRATPLLVLGLLVATLSAAAAQAPAAAETFDAVWRTVRDHHFDPAFDLRKWNAIRNELAPRAARARTSGELRAILADMLGRLGLSHFAVVPSSPDAPGERSDTSGEPGLDVRLIGRQLVVTSVEPDAGAALAGIRPGWVIESIDGSPVSSLLDGIPKETPGRLTQLQAWRATLTKLRGPAASTVDLTLRDGSSRLVSKIVKRQQESGAPVTVGSLPTMYVRVTSADVHTRLDRRAGVIGFNVWMTPVDRPFQEALDRFRDRDGIVIDLRGNPGGLAAMIMGISGHFVTERLTLGVMKTKDAELKFVTIPRLVDAGGERVEPYSGPLAILVDGLTGSASECFAGGLQSLGRARVFGQTSMGQALPALFDRLPNGDVFIHAWGDFVTGSGVRLEGRGVVPDEAVPLLREDLLWGRDRPLEAALAWIDAVKAERPKTPF